MKKNKSLGSNIYYIGYGLALLAVIVIMYTVAWCSNGGFIVAQPLTTHYQSESNVIMRTELVAKCNEVTGTVVDCTMFEYMGRKIKSNTCTLVIRYV